LVGCSTPAASKRMPSAHRADGSGPVAIGIADSARPAEPGVSPGAESDVGLYAADLSGKGLSTHDRPCGRHAHAGGHASRCAQESAVRTRTRSGGSA
jgi:hypothetical protein